MMTPFETFLKKSFEVKCQSRTPRILAEAMGYTLFNGGKRVRPRLVMATAPFLDLNQKVLFSIAAALESFHTFTLIHDDLPCMDDDDVRRGQPSNHIQFGEATALLAGDALLSLAFDYVFDLLDEIPSSSFRNLSASFRRVADSGGVVGGQVQEMSLTDDDSSIEKLFQVHRLKTGVLFRACLEMPGLAAGFHSESEQVRILGELGENLGLAFQIADDLEDPVVEIYPKTSVLAYLSAEAALEKALAPLEKNYLEFQRIFPKSQNGTSDELKAIVNEIEKKLRSAKARN